MQKINIYNYNTDARLSQDALKQKKDHSVICRHRFDSEKQTDECTLSLGGQEHTLLCGHFGKHVGALELAHWRKPGSLEGRGHGG